MVSKNDVKFDIVVVLLSILQYLLIETGTRGFDVLKHPVNFVYWLAGISIFLVVNFLVALSLKKHFWIFGIALTSIVCLFSFGTYFAYEYHGTPFTFMDIKNISTAMAVSDGYIDDILSFHKRYLQLLAICICGIAASLYLKKICIEKRHIVEVIIAVILCTYFWTGNVVPENCVTWSWVFSINTYGYTPCLIRESINELEPVNKPSGYDKDEVERFVSDYKYDTGANTPDIIVILNESFYDLNQILDIENSEEPITYIPSLDGAITGYAVTPNMAGGTNLSEYELLTSNSLEMMDTNVTPFQSLNLRGANSIVSLLKKQGYDTLGTHNQEGKNYNRIVGYNDLGFDTIHFVDDYTGLDVFGNRTQFYTDESTYDNLLSWYESMGDMPRFMYALTVQNHGPWTSNEPEQNIIDTTSDYSEYDLALDEYNSCVYLSDKAFETLVDYYDDSDRDVVIVMVGDHCPTIVPDIVDKYISDYDEDQLQLDSRCVPYVIWSNNKELLKNKCTQEKISMIYLLPTALEAAGAKLSGYYDYLVKIREQVPIITKYAYYYDSHGNQYIIGDSSEYSDLISTYFDLEYASVSKESGLNDFFN
ncbi:MAG: LTA synthase family protein [Clostridium sp.]|nr:LTA synthase family protein [Clostridium sp.]